jgi:RNA ligase (TIGR02306 family)
MRKLGTIRKIDLIRPIPDADAIECAVVGGWTVVIKKGDFKAGDLAIYCEIDSWIPTGLAPFLSKGKEPREYNGVRGERLRTVKLRGQLSQGLLLPLDVLPADDDFNGAWTEGEGVSEALGIQKYEPPIPACLAGKARGLFPSFIPKTDQERIQNLTTEHAEWVTAGLTWELTEKLDGSSMTVYVNKQDQGVCSRNLNLYDTEGNTLWQVAHRDQIITALQDSQRNLAIQGELIGESIQGNPYKIKGQSFYVFDIYDIDKGSYMTPTQRRDFCEFHELLHVPVIDPAGHLSPSETIEGLLKHAEGKSRLNISADREGVVFKCNEKQESFKTIANSYLLKHGDR